MNELDNLSDPIVLENVFVDPDLMGEIAEDAPDVLNALIEDNLEFEPTFLDDIISDYVDAYPAEKHELAELGIIKMVPGYTALETYTFPDEELGRKARTMAYKGRELHKLKFTRGKDYIIPHTRGYRHARMWEHRPTKEVYAEFFEYIAKKRVPSDYKQIGSGARKRCGLWYQRTRADPAFVARAARIIAGGFRKYRPSVQRKLIEYSRGGRPPVARKRPTLLRGGREVGFSKRGFEILKRSVA